MHVYIYKYACMYIYIYIIFFFFFLAYKNLNKFREDFVIFDKSGKVIGITRKLYESIFSKQTDMTTVNFNIAKHINYKYKCLYIIYYLFNIYLDIFFIPPN